MEYCIETYQEILAAAETSPDEHHRQAIKFRNLLRKALKKTRRQSMED